MNYFKAASQLKLRFDSPAGKLSVDDLWDLPLTSKTGRANLNDIARALNAKRKASNEENFVASLATSAVDSAADIGFNVVLEVIKTKEADNAAALQAAERKAQKQKILELLDTKKDEALASKSEDELRALLASL